MRIVPSTLSAVVVSALALCLATPATAQELRQKVGAVLAECATVEASGLYELAVELADLAPERNLDSFLSAVMAEAGDTTDPNRRLCAALALADLKEDATFGKSVFALLEPLA